MKIQIKKQSATTFKDLTPGDCFALLDSESVFFKLQVSHQFEFNATLLDSGQMFHVEHSARVQPLAAFVTVETKE